MVGNNGSKPTTEKGYEALIKPIQDIIAKDWKLKLCSYLDVYIEHIHEPGTVYVNFTEAAVLVQNTSTYYCKRVDLMYDWVRQFCFSLAEKFLEATADDEKPEGKPVEQKTKKKRKNNRTKLHSDELQQMDYIHTETRGINLNNEGIIDGPMKQVLLNACMKIQTKPDTCIPVQQSVTEEMGNKDEFRLHWKIAVNGLLYEDFRYDITQSSIISDMFTAFLPPDIVSSSLQCDDDLGDMGMDVSANDSMDFEAVPPPNPDHSGSLFLPSNVPDHRAPEGSGFMQGQPLDVVDGQGSVAKKPEDNFFMVIPFTSLIMHRKFKRSQVFKLPDELIEDVAQMRKKQKKNNKLDEDGTKESDYNNHLSFSEILGGKSEDMIQYKIGKRTAANLSKRKKRIQKHQENNNLENAADLNDLEDDDHDFDDLMDGLANPTNSQVPANDTEAEPNEFFDDAYEASARLIGEIFKSKNDPLSITKRVAAWHTMIQPVLAQAEARSVFSVNEYGTRILEHFDEVGEVRPFSDMVAGQPREEICRYFLSTLMLANTYNVDIEKTDNDELAKDCLQMKLLSKVRHHEELDANVGATTSNGPLL